MQKIDRKKIAKSLKYRTPEIVLGLSLAGGVALTVYLKKVQPLKVLIPRDLADSILVLEQIGLDTYRDLDYGTFYEVVPITL